MSSTNAGTGLIAHSIATHAIALTDHGRELDWHLDRTLCWPWHGCEVVARAGPESL
jgi:hypothetical protein